MMICVLFVFIFSVFIKCHIGKLFLNAYSAIYSTGSVISVFCL